MKTIYQSIKHKYVYSHNVAISFNCSHFLVSSVSCILLLADQCNVVEHLHLHLYFQIKTFFFFNDPSSEMCQSRLFDLLQHKKHDSKYSQRFSQFSSQLMILLPECFQERVFPKRKSVYSFLRRTRCILKVFGEVLLKAIICLESSLKAPGATSCTRIGPMLPLIRKDL